MVPRPHAHALRTARPAGHEKSFEIFWNRDEMEMGRYACQPWALRTAIIVLRMSFQVCGFIIVALGNMQPSQQMCWKALDGCPSPPRIQKPASCTMSSFPWGSSGRQ